MRNRGAIYIYKFKAGRGGTYGSCDKSKQRFDGAQSVHLSRDTESWQSRTELHWNIDSKMLLLWFISVAGHVSASIPILDLYGYFFVGDHLGITLTHWVQCLPMGLPTHYWYFLYILPWNESFTQWPRSSSPVTWMTHQQCIDWGCCADAESPCPSLIQNVYFSALNSLGCGAYRLFMLYACKRLHKK